MAFGLIERFVYDVPLQAQGLRMDAMEQAADEVLVQTLLAGLGQSPFNHGVPTVQLQNGEVRVLFEIPY